MHTFFCAQTNQIMLIVKGRTRPDETQITSDNAIELWQLVQARPAQKVPEGIDILSRLREEMSRNFGSTQAHGPELGHSKDSVVFSHAVRPIEYRASRGEF